MREFVFHGIITKEKDRYAAVCPELDITAEGNSPEEAEANLKVAVKRRMMRAAGGLKGDFLSGYAPEDMEEKYSRKLVEVLSSPGRFPEFYQFRDAAYAAGS